jgi:hypothetical protein
MLLEADAPVCEKDDNDNEPIHLAAKAGSKEIISLIKEYGGVVTNPGESWAIMSIWSTFYCVYQKSCH